MASGVVAIEGTDRAKVWVELSVTVRIGEYENIHFTAGTSRECRNTAKATTKMRQELTEATEAEVAEALERYTQIAQERANPKRKKGKR